MQCCTTLLTNVFTLHYHERKRSVVQHIIDPDEKNWSLVAAICYPCSNSFCYNQSRTYLLYVHMHQIVAWFYIEIILLN